MSKKNVCFKQVSPPEKDWSGIPVPLTEKTISERKEKILKKMKERGLDQIIIYGDVEHGSNFEYLTGYFTRFEESLLVINVHGEITLVLGNENLNKATKSRITANAVHVPHFSLPNQPLSQEKSLQELLSLAGVRNNTRTGLVGWKMFVSNGEVEKKLYDLPSYIVDTIRHIVGNEHLLSNETDLFIGEHGVRTINNANEVAHYEYGAALASDCILDAMDKLAPGVTEQALGDSLNRAGQHNSIVTIAAAGPRYVLGNMFPTDNAVKCGDTISLTVGYRGGASTRAGYAAYHQHDLPVEAQGYMDAVAVPYFRAYVLWLEAISVGMAGGELFGKIDQILPRQDYHWSLCPGHLVADEEWMSSPIYEGSTEKLLSGMILQIDIIPAVPGFGGASAESTVLLADEKLKQEIKDAYPEMWLRMQKRRSYLIETLGVNLSQDILPMCSSVAFLRPYLLDKERALVCSD